MPHPITYYVPPKYATDTNREFDPSTETHHFGFVVKAVDPGCTLEVQIEEADGRVSRFTTTDDSEKDRLAIRNAIMDAVGRFLHNHSI